MAESPGVRTEPTQQLETRAGSDLLGLPGAANSRPAGSPERMLRTMSERLIAPALAANSGSVFVEALASVLGDREAGWLLGHPTDRTVVDQGVERIGQSAIVQAGADRGLKLFERHVG